MKNVTGHHSRPLAIKKIAVIVCSILAVGFRVSAQGGNGYNPVAGSQPWVTGINPAILSSRYAGVALGLKVFHPGFLPGNELGLNETHINASFPFYLPVSIGCDLRYFSAGTYSELEAAVLLSKEVFDQFAIGAKLGLLRPGFGRQDFKLVDSGDPLLNGNLSRTSFNLGLGVYWSHDRWALGVGLDRVNHPDIGFQTSAVLPRQLFAGASYDFGNITPTLLLQQTDKKLSYGLAIAVNDERYGSIRLSLGNSMPVKLEVQFHLSRDSRLDYNLDFPTREISAASVGSHEIVYHHVLARGPEIGQPRILISADTMRIFEERVIRSMPGELSTERIETVDGLIPAYLKPEGRYRNMLVVPAGMLSRNETRAIRYRRYVELGNEIRQRLEESPELNLILRTDDQSLADARALKRYLLLTGIGSAENIKIVRINSPGRPDLAGFEPGQQNVSHQKPVCSEKTLEIRLAVPGETRQVNEWTLKIYNDRKKRIKTFSGKDQLPGRLHWDWKDQWGNLVEPGRYFCLLSLRARNGKKKVALSPVILVQRLRRTIKLCFRLEARPGENKADPYRESIRLSSGNESLPGVNPDGSF